VAASIIVIAEADADRRTGSELADRVFCAEIDWIEPAVLHDYRTYRGILPNSSFTKWTSVAREVRERGLRVHGRFDNDPAAPDARATRNALRLIAELRVPPDALVLLRDEDGDPRRRHGIQRALESVKSSCPVVIGFAIPKREAWILAGFEAQDDRERSRQRDLVAQLGFDPTHTPERLTGGRKDASPRNPKRSVRFLCEDVFAREQQCWRETPLPTLHERGTGCGLAAYLSDLATLARRVFANAQH
jgi:hypothetical protein